MHNWNHFIVFVDLNFFVSQNMAKERLNRKGKRSNIGGDRTTELPEVYLKKIAVVEV